MFCGLNSDKARSYDVMTRNILSAILLHLFSSYAFAQTKPVYNFPREDTLLRSAMFSAAEAKNNALIASLERENRADYKEVYIDRFKMISTLLKTNRTVTEPDAHNYLQAFLAKIVAANPELKQVPIRLIFSRDWWPNASSLGEGTLVINAGLMVRLKNESELAFVLCHELAHLYLDHGEKSIRKSITTVNSEEFKKEIKRLKKQEYGVNAELEKLLKKLAFNSRRHSREHEAEADLQAVKFLRPTPFALTGATDCLKMLDNVDDSAYYGVLDLQRTLDVTDYPFQKKWIQKESSIFGQMKGESSGLTQNEKDSLRTHPDCSKRISMLAPLIAGGGRNQAYVVDSVLFGQLKERFSIEIIEQLFHDESYSLNLYFSLGLLQQGSNRPYALYSIARVLNAIYDAQINHRLGKVTDKEARGNAPDYNLLCRMLDRLRLSELADLTYHFCRNYESVMSDYAGFQQEYLKAQKNKNQSTQ